MLSALKRAAVTLSALMLCISAPAVLAQPGTGTAPGEEVSFPSDPGIMLASTLETPREFGVGPRPAVVLVSGTGPWTRGAFGPLTPLIARIGLDPIAPAARRR
jgi:hypothetical protein